MAVCVTCLGGAAFTLKRNFSSPPMHGVDFFILPTNPNATTTKAHFPTIILSLLTQPHLHYTHAVMSHRRKFCLCGEADLQAEMFAS